MGDTLVVGAEGKVRVGEVDQKVEVDARVECARGTRARGFREKISAESHVEGTEKGDRFERPTVRNDARSSVDRRKPS